MNFLLIREKPDGIAVRGKLYQENGEFICQTLENNKYLILPLIYRLSVTYSPKFKRPLPLVNDVPNRSGIRIHPGSKPEHSRGCILVKTRSEEEAISSIIGPSKCNITIYEKA